MNTQPLSLERRRIYDPLLRLIHLWNAAAILVLLATGFGAEALEEGPVEVSLWPAHIAAGYALILGLAARLAWGWVGPPSARLSDLWQPRAWLDGLRHLHLPKRPDFGHDPTASLVFLILYALLAAMAVTGLALAAIEHGEGPLVGSFLDVEWLEDVFEEPHEALAFAVAGIVGLHLAAVLYHQFVERVPTAQAMLSGYQYRPSATTGAHHV